MLSNQMSGYKSKCIRMYIILRDNRLESQKCCFSFSDTIFNDYYMYITDTEMVGSIACADMLFRTNLLAMVGGGTAPRFDEKAGAVS